MSSILKALQRLQGDRGGAGSPEPQPALRDELARELTAHAAPSDAAPPGETPSRRVRPVALVAGALLLVAVGGLGWWGLRRGSSPPAAVAPPAAEPVAPAAAELPPALEAGPEAASAPALATTAPAEPARSAPVAAPPTRGAEGDEAPAPGRRIRRAPPAQPTGPPEEEKFVSVPRTTPAPRAPAAESSALAGETPPAELAPEEALPPPLAAAPPPPPAEAEPPRIELVAEGTEGAPQPGAAPAVPAREAPPRDAPPTEAARTARAAGMPVPPEIEVLRTTWHPRPERRVARVRLAGRPAPVDLHEGDAISTLVVKTIEPSGVVFAHGGEELRRKVGGE